MSLMLEGWPAAEARLMSRPRLGEALPDQVQDRHALVRPLDPQFALVGQPDVPYIASHPAACS